MAAVTAGKAGIVINPFSDHFMITPENVVHIKQQKDNITRGYSDQVVETETTVRIGEPSEYPTKMVEAVRSYARTNINQIWLKLMVKGNEQSYLLIVDCKGDVKPVFSAISRTAVPHSYHGLPVDMVPFADEFGKHCARGEPFYRRKKGLFW